MINSPRGPVVIEQDHMGEAGSGVTQQAPAAPNKQVSKVANAA